METSNTQSFSRKTTFQRWAICELLKLVGDLGIGGKLCQPVCCLCFPPTLCVSLRPRRTQRHTEPDREQATYVCSFTSGAVLKNILESVFWCQGGLQPRCWLRSWKSPAGKLVSSTPFPADKSLPWTSTPGDFRDLDLEVEGLWGEQSPSKMTIHESPDLEPRIVIMALPVASKQMYCYLSNSSAKAKMDQSLCQTLCDCWWAVL